MHSVAAQVAVETGVGGECRSEDSERARVRR